MRYINLRFTYFTYLLTYNVAYAEAYLHTKCILIHPAVWPQQTWAENSGGEAPPPFLGGGLGPHLTQSRLG